MAIVRKYTLVDIRVLRPHERVDERHLEELLEQILADGVLKTPVIVDSESMTILDGHHRVAALKRLGASKIPAVLVDYRDPRIRVESWDGVEPPSKDEIVERARRGDLLPPKTTRHVYVTDRGEVHVSELAGEANLPLHLLGAGRRSSRGARRVL